MPEAANKTEAQFVDSIVSSIFESQSWKDYLRDSGISRTDYDAMSTEAKTAINADYWRKL